mmetsp:Transcript_44216/g.126201  ORF Transcript_44216/g.126201 Transcript_44216/m.126201 type:complete len:266 (-) Transcript_44216:2394-3191(-)
MGLPWLRAKLWTCSFVGRRLESAVSWRMSVERSSSSSKTSQAALVGGERSASRPRDRSCGRTSSGSAAAPHLRRRLARSLFRRRARSMVRRQWASLQLKPSFRIRSLRSASSAKACSTGRPKKEPRLFWLLKRTCSRALARLSRMAAARCRRPSESRLFVSMFRTCSVEFRFSASASSWPWGFIMFEFASCRDTMCVLCAMAVISFGAMRGSQCGGGIHLFEKLKSVREGSFSQARWTIQTIQSPMLLVLAGSAMRSARSVMSSM